MPQEARTLKKTLIKSYSPYFDPYVSVIWFRTWGFQALGFRPRRFEGAWAELGLSMLGFQTGLFGGPELVEKGPHVYSMTYHTYIHLHLFQYFFMPSYLRLYMYIYISLYIYIYFYLLLPLYVHIP